MANNKELEIKLQFLDEAQAYLNTLETQLLGMATRGIDLEGVNAALRAAHSIKGGAGMMGYTHLSELAHFLEDALKVLRIKHQELVIDTALERLLLSAVDSLHQVIRYDRSSQAIDPNWLNGVALPIFAQLQAQLGTPEPEDASALLSTDDGQDIIPILFQTEVEGCLVRLEEALATQNPCLKEEVSILAQELGGLGEMLQLSAFSQLCHSIEQAIAQVSTPADIIGLAQVALDSWREAQAQVLLSNFNQIPTYLPGMATATTHPIAITPEERVVNAVPKSLSTPLGAVPLAAAMPEGSDPVFSTVGSDGTQTPQTQGTAFRFSETPTLNEPDNDEATVRVSVRQLNQLNDYFGELTIERNRLDGEIKRLRSLTSLLNQRLRTLDECNTELRTIYDRTSTQTYLDHSAGVYLTSQLLPAAFETNDRSTLTIRDQRGDTNFDTLEMDRYDDRHLSLQAAIETGVRLQEVADDIELSIDTAEQSTRNLQRTARQLQRNLNQLRMQPLSDITHRFPRALRDLSLEYGKSVDLKITGDDTLIDRNILEALQDPLMHLLRNAFDHGIEAPSVRTAKGKPATGTLSIRAFQRSNRTYIELKDDGAGINLTKIRDRAQNMGLDPTLLATASEADLLSLIFEPGFSTADQVTALSGRGVGMDVVRNNLRQVRGDISVDTNLEQGTTFTISVPHTLSVSRALLCESNRMPIAIPTDNLQEMTVIAETARYQQQGADWFTWRNRPVRIVELSKWLAFNCPRQIDSLDNTPSVTVPSLLIFCQNDQWVALEIDRSWGEQEIAIRRVEGNIGMPTGFSNCTILGDGQVVPILNVSDLIRWILSCEGSNIQSASALYNNPLLYSGGYNPLQHLQPVFGPQTRPSVLIVDDSVNVRRLLALTLEKQGYQVSQAKDGLDALEKLDAGLEVHAVICDIEMPRLDGYGFLARLRSNTSYGNLPVTMLTSRTGDKHRQLAMKLGANAYFSKPYREQALLQTLEAAIRPAMAS
jgi:two-component system, chemotaxis family, sensor histidine kinase and response regulator PixL